MSNEAFMPFPFVNRKGVEEFPISMWEKRQYGGKPVFVSPASGLVTPLFPGDIRTVGIQFGADDTTIFYTAQELGKSTIEAMLMLESIDGRTFPRYSLSYPGLYINLGYELNPYGPPQVNAIVKWGELDIRCGVNRDLEMCVSEGEERNYLTNGKRFCRYTDSGHSMELRRWDSHGRLILGIQMGHEFSKKDGHGIGVRVAAELGGLYETSNNLEGLRHWILDSAYRGIPINPGLALIHRTFERSFSVHF